MRLPLLCECMCVCMVCVPPYGRVCVADNGMGAEGARSLSEALKFCSELRKLDLSRELAVLLVVRCESGGAWLTHMELLLAV